MAEVLLVDDSAVMRELLTEAIDDPHTVIDEASNGREAVEIVEERDGSIDVILMDIVMPELDGIEATRQIKSMYPSLKVVFCTSVTQQDRMKDAIEAGADGYIPKPFEEGIISVAIEDALS